VPASSILEPNAGSRGTLYVYEVSGIATVDGILWVYIDENNRPARQSCVLAQVNCCFRFDNLMTIDATSPYARD
jgi:hypothetical protein